MQLSYKLGKVELILCTLQIEHLRFHLTQTKLTIVLLLKHIITN